MEGDASHTLPPSMFRVCQRTTQQRKAFLKNGPRLLRTVCTLHAAALQKKAVLEHALRLPRLGWEPTEGKHCSTTHPPPAVPKLDYGTAWQRKSFTNHTVFACRSTAVPRVIFVFRSWSCSGVDAVNTLVDLADREATTQRPIDPEKEVSIPQLDCHPISCTESRATHIGPDVAKRKVSI